MSGPKFLPLAAALCLLAACSTLPRQPVPAALIKEIPAPAAAATDFAADAADTADTADAADTAGPAPADEPPAISEAWFPTAEAFRGGLPLPEPAAEPGGKGSAIMGKGRIGAEDLASFLLSGNPGADPEYIKELSFYYVEEAEAEGVNHDVAFAQMCLETGFLQFGGLVSPDMNNFCGLGSIGPGAPGERFPSPRTGVRAHIQHLKAYATNSPLARDLVDPRYQLVRRGSAPVLSLLSGTWAADKQYADKIEAILERLYRFAE